LGETGAGDGEPGLADLWHVVVAARGLSQGKPLLAQTWRPAATIAAQDTRFALLRAPCRLQDERARGQAWAVFP